MNQTESRIVSVVGMVAAAGLAWLAHITSGLVLVMYACTTSEVPIHVIGVVALVLSMVAAVHLLRTWKKDGAESRLVSFVGLMMVLLFVVSIVFSEAWVVFFDPCFL